VSIEVLDSFLERDGSIASHTDADGVCSLVLLSYRVSGRRAYFPENFGELEEDTLICLDMVPVDTEWSGLCIDHHPHHSENRRYTLIWDRVPTSLIVYRLVRDYIPEEERWKVAVGLVGDNQPELIPVEIWERFPELLDEYHFTNYSYGSVKGGSYTLYKLLSSGINNLCRVNHPEIAVRILKNAESPLDLIRDQSIREAREIVEKELKRVFEEGFLLEVGKILYFEFSSDLNITSRVATLLWKRDDTTVIVYNRRLGKGSVRGVLSTLIQKKLEDVVPVGGHAGYMGFRIEPDTELLPVIRSRLRKEV